MPIENQADNSADADYLISYPRSFVTTTGNMASAILLSQLLRLSKNATETDGWIPKTETAWRELTGLTRHEQIAARKILRTVKVLEEEVRGMPATLYFRLNYDELARLLPEAVLYAENGNLVSNLVCSSKGVGADAAKSPVNQFAEGGKPLEDKVFAAVIHPKAEAETSRLVFEGLVRDAFVLHGKNIGTVKKQTEQLNTQGAVKTKLLDQIKRMIIGLLVMVSLILILSIIIWWTRPSVQSYVSPQKPTPTPMSNPSQYRW